MYALVEIKGKQYKAEQGKWITVDLCEEKEGSVLEFPVLMLSNEGKTEIGAPYLAGKKAKVKVLDSYRDKKIVVFKYQKRKRMHKTIGHRQSYTRLMVESVG